MLYIKKEKEKRCLTRTEAPKLKKDKIEKKKTKQYWLELPLSMKADERKKDV